jgi:predicted phage terminase large subunit-like protein
VATRSEKLRQIFLYNEKEKRLCEKSYYCFFQRAWQIIEPSTSLKLNWHIKYLCDVIESEIRRIGAKIKKTKDIIVNISPRSAKSQIFSVMLCPWTWIHYPWIRFMSSSHSSDLSIIHSVQSRDVINSDWYQRNWNDRFKMKTDQNVKSYFQNDKRGHRMAVSVGSGAIGKGGDIVVADDILSFENSLSETKRNASNDHYEKGLYTRINDQDIGLRIAVMQRLHQDDTTGHVLKNSKDDYLHINIPAEITQESINTEFDVSPAHLKQFYDKDGLFFPARFSRDMLDKAKSVLRSQYPGQFLQRVSEPGGSIWKRKWFRYYGGKIRFEREIIVCDMNFKEGEKNSFVVIQHWGRLEGKNYLINQYREQVGFLEARAAFIRMCKSAPNVRKKIVEDKANGPALINSLEKIIPGLVAEPKDKSKESCWLSVADIIQDGKVLLPNPEENPWVVDYLDECDKIPNSTYDDQADATYMALKEFDGSSIETLKKFLTF